MKAVVPSTAILSVRQSAAQAASKRDLPTPGMPCTTISPPPKPCNHVVNVAKVHAVEVRVSSNKQ
jgi:hypothetical protein